MARRRNRHDMSLSADINVTSLVDVAFTLLVIFLITAPIMQGGVEIQVPRAQSEMISSDDEGVIVTVTREGEIYIDKAQASWEEFEPALTDAVRARQATTTYVRADENAPYGEVLRVIGAMKNLDIATVGLVADPIRSNAP
jgi:biopolymer transport protein ExbD